MHSDKFFLILEYYNQGLWSESRVREAVGRWILPSEYKEITGSDYHG